MKNRGEVAQSLFVGAACAGIGIVSSRFMGADTGDVLAFAGGLIGAGAAVWGAFAVVERTAAEQRRGARHFLRDLAKGVIADMLFLLDLQSNATRMVEEHGANVVHHRLDAIAAGLPQTAVFLVENNLALTTSDIGLLASELRFKAALIAAEPEFAHWHSARREWRLTKKDELDLTVLVPSIVIEDLRDAAAIAFAECSLPS